MCMYWIVMRQVLCESELCLWDILNLLLLPIHVWYRQYSFFLIIKRCDENKSDRRRGNKIQYDVVAKSEHIIAVAVAVWRRYCDNKWTHFFPFFQNKILFFKCVDELCYPAKNDTLEINGNTLEIQCSCEVNDYIYSLLGNINIILALFH